MVTRLHTTRCASVADPDGAWLVWVWDDGHIRGHVLGFQRFGRLEAIVGELVEKGFNEETLRAAVREGVTLIQAARMGVAS